MNNDICDIYGPDMTRGLQLYLTNLSYVFCLIIALFYLNLIFGVFPE